MKHLLIASMCLLAADALAGDREAILVGDREAIEAQQIEAVLPTKPRTAASVAVTQTATITITVTGGFVTAVACNPSAPSVPDTAPAGTIVCALSATISDGTPFTGKFGLTGAAAPGMFTLSADGKSIVTARALTSADVSPGITLTMSAAQ